MTARRKTAASKGARIVVDPEVDGPMFFVRSFVFERNRDHVARERAGRSAADVSGKPEQRASHAAGVKRLGLMRTFSARAGHDREAACRLCVERRSDERAATVLAPLSKSYRNVVGGPMNVW